MKYKHLPYTKTEAFSPLVIDYLNKSEKLEPFYNRFPDLESFGDQIREKSSAFDMRDREVLVKSLSAQYEKTFADHRYGTIIESLGNENTFTITTGHQLNIATGPLYFVYKIASAIHLCRTLKERYSDKTFIPIYWMATEDHDLDEIQFFYFRGKRKTWKTDQRGAVGRMSPKGLVELIESLDLDLGISAREIRHIIIEAYGTCDTLADAQRKLVHRLFGNYELLVVDGDDQMLKKRFAPIVQKELEEQWVTKAMEKTLRKLGDNYNIQVNPREVNLFYLTDNSRERLDAVEGEIIKVDSREVFDKQDWLRELDSHPERFSPNVLLRPLYQELILPNLAYIGGGAEVAYWMELSAVFEKSGIPMPILMLRNSAMIAGVAENRSRQKLGLSWRDLFRNEQVLVNSVIHKHSNEKLDFTPYIKKIEAYFDEMEMIAERTEQTFKNAVNAQRAKQLKGIAMLEKRLLKAERRKYQQLTDRVISLKKRLFPKGLQERRDNIVEYYAKYGPELIDEIVEQCDPLRFDFVILYEEWNG